MSSSPDLAPEKDADTTADAASSATTSPDTAKTAADYGDHEDAGKGEITIYSLGGVIDELTTSGFRNLNSLLVIAFQVSPLIVGCIGALKSIWDGLVDPLIANWSDNCKSRFGRRRPFILAGGVLMALIAWVTWQFMPENDKLLPNDPVVPTVQAADEHWKQFADLHLAYGASDYTLRVAVENDPSGRVDAAMLRGFAEDSLKSLAGNTKKTVRLLDSSEAATAPASVPSYLVTFAPLAASAVVAPGGETAVTPPFDAALEARLTGPGLDQPLVTRVQADLVSGKITPRERERVFAEELVEFFTGRPAEAGVTLRSADTELKLDVLEHRGAERALLAAQRLALIELLSRHLGLPYDRILSSDTGSVSAEAGARLREKASALAAADPGRRVALYVSNGLQINPQDGVDSAEQPLLDAFRSGLGDESAAWTKMYEETPIEKAASLQSLHRDPLKTGSYKSTWEKLEDGFNSFLKADQQQKNFIWFILLVFLLMAVGGSLYSSAYYAQGIEIAPSYNGRTLVVAYRSVANSAISIICSIFLPLSLLPVFVNSAEGSLFLVYVTAPIGLALAFLVFFGTKERTVIVRTKDKKPSFFRSVREIGATWEFWRITLLYIFMGYALGSFSGLGGLLSIYYVFEGNLILGASYGAITGIIGTLVATATIPLFVYLCKRFGKHNALRMALGSLAFASVAKYFCYDPDMPELMFIPPFLYSPAIAGFYNILGSMMGDVTDYDELRNGERREGMFGAVMSVIMKTLGSFTPIAAGVITVAAGFEIEKSIHQDPGVFDRMRILFSVVPGVVSLIGFSLLMRFTLTEEGVNKIKEQLAIRRKARAQANA